MVQPYQFVLIGGITFLLGVALGSRIELALFAFAIAGILLLLVLFLRPTPAAQLVAVAGLGLLLGWWRCQTVFLSAPTVADLDSKTVVISGLVVSDPEVADNQQKLHLLVQTVNEEPRQFKLLLTAWHLPALQYADSFSGQVKFSLPRSEDTFSYANYLAKDGIYISAKQSGDFTREAASRPTLLGTLYQAKRWVKESIHRFLPEPHSGLLAGLLLGIKADLSDDFKAALKNSGTSHVVALSGFNLTVIIAFLLFSMRRLPRRWVWLISGVAILGFVVMTGAASSVVRAAIMGWLLLLSSLWGRQRHLANAVLLAVVIMVFIHPLILFYDVGFQLSVAATLGILYGSPLFPAELKYIPAVLQEAFASTTGATLFTLPLIALYFGGVSWVTLGANLLVVPLVPYVMLIGSVGLAAFLIFPALQWLTILVWPLSALLMKIIYWFGTLPSAFIPLPPLPIWIPVSYYVLLVVIVYYVYTHREISPTLD